MQIKLIKKNTSTGRVEFYDPTNVFLGSVPATSPMRVGKNTVNFNGVGDDIFSIGYNADFTTTQIDAGSVTPAPNTFALFLSLLQTSFFNATNAGGSGGGGGGDASAALQQQQLDEAVYQTQFQGAILDSVGSETDSPATNPSGSASQIALQKGIFANGFKSNIFELVVDPITGTQYLKSVMLDPNTPPIEFKYYDPVTGLVATSPTNPTYPVISSLGVGEPTDLKAIDPNDNASLVSLSKGQLENLALMQEVLGYGGSPIVIDPALGGTISGVLKGILYNVAPPVPTNSYFLNTGALTVGQDFRSLLNASQSRKITGGVFSARASAGDKMLILFDYQPGGTAPTATDIRAVYVLPSGNHSIQIAPMNFESGIWVLVAQSSNTDNPASLTALSANHASVSIFHEPTTLV